MSKSAGCTRAAGLKLLGYKPKPFSGSTQVTFWTGHMLELMAICSLEAIGYPVDGAQNAVTIDPFMHSYSDGIVTLGDHDAILTVKSTAYKMGGKKNGTFIRRGFAELPFGGCKTVQPGWWAQAQAEMYGSGLEHAFLVVIAKDIVKAFENDEYLGPRGNGSLAFYCEEIPFDREWCERNLIPAWTAEWNAVQAGVAGPALYLNNESLKFISLDKGNTDRNPNAMRTGTFSPCAYCDWVDACKEAK